MATFSSGGVDRDGLDMTGPFDGSLGQMAKKAAHLSLPGFHGASTRSLFIFSEENFIRKYAKIIIEWGYPFNNLLWNVLYCFMCVYWIIKFL